MSQVGKLKAPATLLLAQTHAVGSSSAIVQQRRFMHSAAPVRQINTQMVRPSAGMMQRWFTSNAKQQAAAATEMAAPASAASASSSSSSPALMIAALLAGAGGLLMLGSDSTVHAEAGVDLPTVPLGGMAAGSAQGAPVSGGEKKKKKKKRAGVRKPLAYPGKLGNLSRDASSVVQVQTSQGMRMQFPLSAFTQMQQQDKSCMFVPVLEMGGPNGSSAQLVIHTHLGRSHKLEAVVDTASNVIGSYKYAADNGFSIKPTVQVTPNGNGFSIDMDYKGKEFALAATIAQMQEFVVSYCRSLTPTIAAGVEVHYAMGAFTNLNGAARYTSTDGAQQFIVSKKDAKYTATSVTHKHTQRTCAPSYSPSFSFLLSCRFLRVRSDDSILMHRSSEY